MLCQHCGAEIKILDARFCQKCGNALNTTPSWTTPASHTPSTEVSKAPKPIGAIGWLIYILMTLSYGSIGLALIDAMKIDPRHIGSAIMLSGIAFAHSWHRQGRSGWWGFLLGVALGTVLLFLMAFVAGFIRGIT